VLEPCLLVVPELQVHGPAEGICYDHLTVCTRAKHGRVCGADSETIDHAIMAYTASSGEEATDWIDAGVVRFLSDQDALDGIAPGEGVRAEPGAYGEDSVCMWSVDIG
jgi:hypothetical protein